MKLCGRIGRWWQSACEPFVADVTMLRGDFEEKYWGSLVVNEFVSGRRRNTICRSLEPQIAAAYPSASEGIYLDSEK
jgi:hypothetical protein